MKKLTCPHFTLTEKLSEEQLDFFNTHGVIIFKNFIKRETIDLFLSEIK